MVESKDEAQVRENANRDAKAFCLIQHAVDSPILDRIADAKMAYEVWEILNKQCQGTTKVLAVRIQALKQSFETMQMEDNKGI